MAVEEPQKKKSFSFLFLLLCIGVIGGLYFWRTYEVRFDTENNRGLVFKKRADHSGDSEAKTAAPQQADPATGLPLPPPPPLAPPTKEVLPLKTFRIGSWDLTPLDFNKMADETRAGQIADVVSEFDLIAIQGVVQTTLPLDELLRRIKEKGKNFAYITPNSVGNTPEYVAFLLNTATVKYDSQKTYDIADATLTFRPLVATFLTVEPAPEKAFTFNLVNVKIADDRKESETKKLGQLFRMVRDRDVSEDDVIMLGNFGIPAHQIDSLRSVPYLTVAQEDMPTTLDGTDSTENILFDRLRTVECVGNLYTIDLIKRFNLKLSEAKPIANHLPIGITFSVFEAGTTGQPTEPH